MPKQKMTVNVHEDLRAIPAHLLRPRQVRKPGDRLRRAVEAALAELAVTATPDEQTRRRIDNHLVGGLAWAAATGDTCRIEPAVDKVRTARARLGANEPDGARTALLAAREGLGSPLPSQRDAR